MSQELYACQTQMVRYRLFLWCQLALHLLALPVLGDTEQGSGIWWPTSHGSLAGFHRKRVTSHMALFEGSPPKRPSSSWTSPRFSSFCHCCTNDASLCEVSLVTSRPLLPKCGLLLLFCLSTLLKFMVLIR